MRKTDPTLPKLGKKLEQKLTIHHEFYGEEYGRITYEGLEAQKQMERDGIHLETTYTAKAFSGQLDYCKSEEENQDLNKENGEKRVLLFWNTHNSRDMQSICDQVDYKNLPKSFHKFFNGEVPLDDIPVHAKKIAKH